MGKDLSLLLYLVRLRIRSRLQSRLSLVLAWVSQTFGYAGIFGSIWIILHRFGDLGGWTPPQMLFFFGFMIFGYALGACFTLVQLRGMESLVRDGNYDTLLTRPISPFLFLSLSGINLEYVSHFVMGAGLMAWTAPQIGLSFDGATVLLLLGGLASAALLTGGLLTIIGASALVLGRSRYLFGLYFDFWEMARYPASIYALPLQILMLTILPYGYLAYVPVSVLLGKPVPYLGPAAPAAALLAGPLMVALAALFWRYAQRRYQGAGG